MSLRLCDAHCHVDSLVRLRNSLAVLNELGPTLAVTNDWLSYLDTRSITRGRQDIWVSLGLHPLMVSSQAEDLSLVTNRLQRIRFVGEIGLDYAKCKDASERKSQSHVFEAILEACEGSGKVLNVHSRGAERNVVQTLKSFDIHKVVLHWYVGSRRQMHDAIDEGWFFSIPSAVCRSAKLQRVAREVPENQLLVESDVPSALRGEFSTQKALHSAAAQIARLRQISVAHISDTTSRNFLNLIGRDGDVSHGQRTLGDWKESCPEVRTKPTR